MCFVRWVSSNVQGCLVVTKNQGRLGMIELEIFKQSAWSHVSSHVKAAIDLYSASAEDLETVCCFLDFYETRE